MPVQRVAIAMSGGVDSSTSAAILKERGYDVFGVTMRLSAGDSGEAAESARAVARLLGIPHHVLDFREVFTQRIISDFCREYGSGRTPNPCVFCNQYLKFGALLDTVRQMGAECLATGHYARIEHNGGYRLLKGIDNAKDQSYFLYRLVQDQLKYVIFPVGDRHKSEVKKLAVGLGLPSATRKESRDICFLPGDDYRAFLARHTTFEPGDIVDTDGKILGKHSGLALYTVGQRQKLGIYSGHRLYVLKMDAASNRVVVGTEEYLLKDRLVAGNLNWIAGEAPGETFSASARVRYRSPEAPATIHLKDGRAEVHFQQAQRAIAPGQSIVFYRGDGVLGGGIIEDVL
jgi:tRNA-specific 2-thiouridylase